MPDTHAVRSVRWLLLHDLLDTSAPWLMRQWRARQGPAADGLLALDTLALDRHVQQAWHLGSTGQTWGRWLLSLPGQPATLIDTSQLVGILNRYQPCRTPPQGPDADYKLMERHAILLAWLHALGSKVLNRPSPDHLGGPLPPLLKLRLLASDLGLPIAAARARSGQIEDDSTHGRLVTILSGLGALWGPGREQLPPALHAPALRLTEALGYDLVGLQFCLTADGRWLFAGIQPAPDLRPGGSPLAARLAEHMGMDMSRHLQEVCT